MRIDLFLYVSVQTNDIEVQDNDYQFNLSLTFNIMIISFRDDSRYSCFLYTTVIEIPCYERVYITILQILGIHIELGSN